MIDHIAHFGQWLDRGLAAHSAPDKRLMKTSTFCVEIYKGAAYASKGLRTITYLGKLVVNCLWQNIKILLSLQRRKF